LITVNPAGVDSSSNVSPYKRFSAIVLGVLQRPKLISLDRRTAQRHCP
jgi:hypothetical protein